MGVMNEYQNKVVSPEEAVNVVKSGDKVHYGHFAMSPTFLDPYLAKRKDELQDVKVYGVTYPGLAQVGACDETRDHFMYHSWHFSGGDRMLHDKGLCNYIPMLYQEGPELIRRYVDPGVVMIKVAPMDERGYFNFSVSNSDTYCFVKKATKMIVEVCNKAPYCLGGNNEAVHISDVDMIVETDNKPLIQVPFIAPTDVDKAVAAHVMKLIEDGSVIQLGIGGMPNAVGAMLAQSDLKDLGCHTEVLVDSYVDMFEAGVMTGRRKTFDRGKMVYTFALGSQKLYDFLHMNRAAASCSVDYTNNTFVIAQNYKPVSINGTIEVDLFGQCCSETIGTQIFGGIGGQLDFARGVTMNPEGQGFIVLQSTTKNDTITKIVPTLTPGAVVSTTRTLVDHVVTEYGCVKLRGKSMQERAQLLISVAHPNFRDMLTFEAKKIGLLV